MTDANNLVYDKRNTCYVNKAERINKQYKILKKEMRKKHNVLHYVLWLGTPEGKVVTKNGKAIAVTIGKNHRQAELLEVGKVISWRAGNVNNRLGYIYQIHEPEVK